MMRHQLPDTKTMYRALVQRDGAYEGIFVAGVKSTGIFCRPTCTARKPKAENVEFFPTAQEALQRGYRPCRLCQPLVFKGTAARWLKPLLDEAASNPGIRLTDHDLRQRGVDPNRVRRWFKKNHGMTFQCYLRTLRIGQAFGQIKYGDKVTAAAFDNGYESLSGFGASFKKTTGFAPASSPDRRLIIITRLLTPLGPMLAGAIDEGICLFDFIDRRMMETQMKRLQQLLHAELIPGVHPLFEQLDQEIKAYFAGSCQTFTVPLLVPGTPFQQKVWKALQQIPYGETRSYEEQAAAIGQPKAIRAVAHANGLNRIAIIIPCHRVIGKDGKLVGYGGGLQRKKFLLELERTKR